MDIIALVGSVCFAISAIPAAMLAWRERYCRYQWGFLLLWLIGELCMIGYAIGTTQPILLLNYLPNLASLAVIMHYNDRKGPHDHRTR